MSTVAQFGSKTFSVGGGKINTFDGFGWSSTLSTEKKEAVGKKPATSIKGPGADQLKLTALLWMSLGVNPREEIESWIALKDAAVAYPFVLGSAPCGQNKYLLTKCDVSDVQMGAGGQMIGAKLSLAFEEYLSAGAKGSGSGGKAGSAIGSAGANVPNPYMVGNYTPQEKAVLKMGLKMGGGVQ